MRLARVAGGIVLIVTSVSLAQQILATVQADLTDVRTTAHATEGQLSPTFLTDPV